MIPLVLDLAWSPQALLLKWQPYLTSSSQAWLSLDWKRREKHTALNYGQSQGDISEVEKSGT
jgi:hypothetical protein